MRSGTDEYNVNYSQFVFCLILEGVEVNYCVTSLRGPRRPPVPKMVAETRYNPVGRDINEDKSIQNERAIYKYTQLVEKHR